VNSIAQDEGFGDSLKIFQNPTLKQEEENKIVTLVSYELSYVFSFSEKLTCTQEYISYFSIK
jgi:hypothetical protein